MLKYFQHDVNASKKRVFVELEKELGYHVGIACYWLFVEHFMGIWNVKKDPTFTVSESQLKFILGISRKKCVIFMEIMGKNSGLILNFFQKNSNKNIKKTELFYNFTFHKMIETLDKHTKYRRKLVAENDKKTTLEEKRIEENRKEKKKEKPLDANAPTHIIFELWNKHRESLSEAKIFSLKRKKVCAVRWKENPNKDFWENAMLKIKESPFLNGNNERGWQADFDWFIAPDNALKIIENKYQDNKGEKFEIRS